MIENPYYLSKMKPLSPGRFLIENKNVDVWTDRICQASLALILAPAGFGKTTTMFCLFEKFQILGIKTAWVQLDEDDNQLEQFCIAINAALDRILLVKTPKKHQNSDGFESIHNHRLLTSQIMDKVKLLREPSAIFLDNFENILSEAVVGLVQKMIEQFPEKCQLIIASRTTPKLKVSRLKVQGRLVYIHGEDLNFSEEQAEKLFNESFGLSLDIKSIRRLIRATEGWVTGLQLAALALSTGRNSDAFIDNLKGDSSDISEYLYEEVMESQTLEIQRFLLLTSVIESLTDSLCNAVTGNQSSIKILKQLNQDNLFTFSLDDSGKTYRYHKLFAEFLRRKLKEDYPGKDIEIHLIVADELAKQGMNHLAIKHALIAKDYNLACQLLEQTIWHVIAVGKIRTAHKWLNRIPEPILKKHPRLQVALCWTHIFHYNYELANQLANEIKKIPEVYETDEMRVLEPLSLMFLDKWQECEDIIKRNSESILPVNHIAYGTIHNIKAGLYLASKRYDEVSLATQKAKVAFSELNDTFGLVYSTWIDVQALFIQGHLKKALTITERMYETTVMDSSRYSNSSALAATQYAELVYESGDYSKAKYLLEVYLEIAQTVGPTDSVISCHRVLSRCYCRYGDANKARNVVNLGRELGYTRKCNRLIDSMNLEDIYIDIYMKESDITNIQSVAEGNHSCSHLKDYVPPANDVESVEISEIRLSIYRCDPHNLVKQLPAMIYKAAAQHRFHLRLKLHIFNALALFLSHETDKALKEIHIAVLDAYPEGFVSIFHEEGPEVLRLLQLLRDTMTAGEGALHSPDLLNFIKLILDENKKPTAIPFQKSGDDLNKEPLETLSKRELQVLRLLAAGLSNKTIAEQSFISENTVKFHLRNINSKLGAKSRTQAVFLGRHFKIID